VSGKKRRPRGEGGVHQRKDGLWVGTLDLGYRDGKRRRKVVYAKTKTGAIRKLGKARTELAQHGDLPTTGETVERWLRYWLEDLAGRRVKPGTLAAYRTAATEWIIPAIGGKRLDRLTPADVRAVHRYVESKGLTSTSALHAHRALGTALRAAVRDGRINRNVAAAEYTDAPRRAAHGRTGLSADQAKAVLLQAAEDRLASRWLAAFLTGARQGELLGLRWQYVDLEVGVLDLAWSLGRLGYRHGCDGCGKRPQFCPQRRLDMPAGMEYEVLDGNLTLTRPKTKGSRRLVPIAPPLAAALKLRFDAYLAERPSYVTDHGLVWPREDGRPIDGRVDWRAWKALLAAAGAPSVTLHEARNTAASLLHEAGVDDNTSALILGHSSVMVTRGYQRHDLTHARDAVAELGRLLEIEL
jgi:integrase